MPVATFGGTEQDIGRMTKITNRQGLGPGCYELPQMVPSGPSAIIAPEPPPPSVSVAKAMAAGNPCPPGPADYHLDRGDALMYPRDKAADFSSGVGHAMEFQRVPKYIRRYKALDPRWEAIRRRSLSAVILPVHRVAPPSAVPERPDPGPGAYDVGAADELVRRVRADQGVTSWAQPHSRPWLCEHVRGLFTDRPVDPAVRGDRREFLGPDSDWAVRRRHAAAVINPLSLSLPARTGDVGVWRLYDPTPAPCPPGLADFSGRVDFEDFSRREASLLALQGRMERRHRPNARLAYSLPHLEVTKARAPLYDFSRLCARPASEGDAASPREGDVLRLSTNFEKELFHARAPAPVDMARMRGRAESAPPALAAEVDDFEELVLDPQQLGRRPSMYVDMARMRGRADESEMSAHLWADADGVVYAYQPTAGLRLRDPDADELLLDPLWSRLRRRSPAAAFEHLLGRPGVDPRVRGSDESEEADVVLTNWAPPPSLARRPRAARSRSPLARGGGGGGVALEGVVDDDGGGAGEL